MMPKDQLTNVRLHTAEQGTDEWAALRCGLLTGSTIREIVTPTLKIAANDKTRALANKLAIQRVTGLSEETFTSDKMLRGHIDEDVARNIYSKKYAPVTEVGFITNSDFPHLGYSPDGLVGDDGLIEVKSRDPHLHLATIIARENGEGIPKEYMAQVQAGLLISEREWCDFISFSHGLPMMVHRVFPDLEYRAALIEAATEFEATVQGIILGYRRAVMDDQTYTPTERIDYEEMIL